MKKYDIEIIFQNNTKETICGYEDYRSGLEIMKRVVIDLEKGTKHFMFAVKNDIYLYDFNDIKHLKILEVD